MGGTMWLGVSDEQSKAALELAIHLGVTFVDTALVYGEGHSERLIAEVRSAQGWGRDVVVATKIPPKNYVWPGDPQVPLRKVFPPRHIVKCVEKSLKNLRVEALDLEQLHVWHDAWLHSPEWPATREAMVRCKEQGKVKHWGVSVNDHAPGTALRLLQDPLFETVQVIYNIFDRSAESALLQVAGERDLGVIARVPFDEGALTGTIRSDTIFLKRDWRESYFRGGRKAEAARRADALSELLGAEAETLPELALRFCLSRAEVATVIPGMRLAEHARQNTAVSDGRPLSPALLRKLEAHAFPKNWYQA